MPVGIMITEDEVSAVNAAIPEGDADRPSLFNNLFMFEPRFGLRLVTRLSKFEPGEDHYGAALKFVNRLLGLMGSNESFRNMAFEGPGDAPTPQFNLFEEDEPSPEPEDYEGDPE